MKQQLTLGLTLTILFVVAACNPYPVVDQGLDIAALFSETKSAATRIIFADSTTEARSLQMGIRLTAANAPRISREPTLERAASIIPSMAFAMAGYQSGNIVASNSSDTLQGNTSNTTITYKVYTSPDGGTTLWGGNGHMQTFTTSDPNLKLETGTQLGIPLSWPNFADGENGMLTGPGAFMVTFSPTDSTQLVVVPTENPANITSIDEIVLRMYAYTMQFDSDGVIGAGGNGITGGSVIVQPHFLYDDGSGVKPYYCGQNLTVNGSQSAFSDVQYIAFLPSSVVGEGFNYLLTSGSDGTVSNPVLGDEMELIPGSTNSSQFVNEPSTWTINENWINLPGNDGLFTMIDSIAGTDRTQDSWKNKAIYFRNFFAKYYKALCMMFYSGSPAHWSVQIIALNPDSQGRSALDISNGESLQVVYDNSEAFFALNGDTLELTASPALKFEATVVAP